MPGTEEKPKGRLHDVEGVAKSMNTSPAAVLKAILKDIATQRRKLDAQETSRSSSSGQTP
jgi:hypothetical protein